MLIKPEFSRWIFETYNKKVHEILPVGTELFNAGGQTYVQIDGLMDGQTDIAN